MLTAWQLALCYVRHLQIQNAAAFLTLLRFASSLTRALKSHHRCPLFLGRAIASRLSFNRSLSASSGTRVNCALGKVCCAVNAKLLSRNPLFLFATSSPLLRSASSKPTLSLASCKLSPSQRLLPFLRSAPVNFPLAPVKTTFSAASELQEHLDAQRQASTLLRAPTASFVTS